MHPTSLSPSVARPKLPGETSRSRVSNRNPPQGTIAQYVIISIPFIFYLCYLSSNSVDFIFN
ncbi:hypothetical protein ACFW04_000647 [Cataglyphis niger]